MKRLLEWIVNLAYPRRACCMGCGDMLGLDRDDLCEACRSAQARRWIGARMPEKDLLLDGAAYCYPYAGVGGSVVRRMKYSNVWVLAGEMGRDIARAAGSLRMGDGVIVTSVPMHPRRLRERGRNHSELLACAAAEVLGLEYRSLLARTRNAPQQARLEGDARRKNLMGAFAACELPQGSRVLLNEQVTQYHLQRHLTFFIQIDHRREPGVPLSYGCEQKCNRNDCLRKRNYNADQILRMRAAIHHSRLIKLLRNRSLNKGSGNNNITDADRSHHNNQKRISCQSQTI